jgi:type VI secretion system protein ImpM
MQIGLYGKLPTKRDFIAVAVTRPWLAIWEPWMQGGLSASQAILRDDWRDVYLRAPIWRFWLGQDICGGTAMGAFMPSVDGVGRYFPLTVVAQAQPPEAMPPPELDPQDSWFAQAEDMLLAALDSDRSYDDVTAALGRIPSPLDLLAASPPEGMVRLADGSVLTAASPADLPQKLASMRIEDHARSYGHQSVWWTLGGEDYPPLALVSRQLPSPHLFAGLLTGRFDDMPRR